MKTKLYTAVLELLKTGHYSKPVLMMQDYQEEILNCYQEIMCSTPPADPAKLIEHLERLYIGHWSTREAFARQYIRTLDPDQWGVGEQVQERVDWDMLAYDIAEVNCLRILHTAEDTVHVFKDPKYYD